jgi:hypothetical protein
MIDTESDPGAWADAIAHSPSLRVEEYTSVEVVNPTPVRKLPLYF